MIDSALFRPLKSQTVCPETAVCRETGPRSPLGRRIGPLLGACGLLFLSLHASAEEPPEQAAEELLEKPEEPRDAFGVLRPRPVGVPQTEVGPSGDGVYGRFLGDMAWSLGLGGELDFSSTSLRPQVRGALRFYQAVGVYAHFTQAVQTDDPWERGVSAGLLIEPLFLLRWPDNKQTGRALLDLTIDSLSLSVGATVIEPRSGNFADKAVFDLGLGFGVPLLGRANGLWLRPRGVLRLLDDTPQFVLQLGLEWQGFFESALLSDP